VSLQDLLKIYFTEKTNFAAALQTLPKQKLEVLLKEIIEQYANDKNSSTLREQITVSLAGYDINAEKKLGYNGRRDDTVAEAKPVNVRSDDPKKKKLNGRGNFSDLTPERFQEYLKEASLNMVVSGFVDGELVYVLEFPFGCPSFTQELERQLKKHYPKWQVDPHWKREKNDFLRSARFDSKHYKKCNLRIIYVTPNLVERKKFLTKDLVKYLELGQ
jgi:hypothetical protein